MTQLLQIVAYVGLALALLPALLFYGGAIDLDTLKLMMLIGSLLWLGAYGYLRFR